LKFIDTGFTAYGWLRAVAAFAKRDSEGLSSVAYTAMALTLTMILKGV